MSLSRQEPQDMLAYSSLVLPVVPGIFQVSLSSGFVVVFLGGGVYNAAY